MSQKEIKAYIDKNLVVPSFINKEYLEKKFNDLETEKKEELNMNHNKIIINKKKLSIIEVDKTKNVENKIYESDDFTKVIKKLSKIKKKVGKFSFRLVENMKNGIFIIESKNMVCYGAYFFMKYNKSKKEIEIISEEGDRLIEFITEYANGNFAYKSYVHRPIYTEDCFYVFDTNKNKTIILKSFGEYEGAYDSEYAPLKNGFAFNNYLCFDRNSAGSYLNIVEGFTLKRYNVDFIGQIQQLISDDKYIYLLSKNDNTSVYIFNIENQKFYSNIFKISVKIKKYEIEEEIEEENENEDEKNEEENKKENEEKNENEDEKKNEEENVKENENEDENEEDKNENILNNKIIKQKKKKCMIF